MAAPLTNLTIKDIPFVWNAACEAALLAVKHALTNAPVLALPKFLLLSYATHQRKALELYCYKSKAISMQEQKTQASRDQLYHRRASLAVVHAL
eukprot:1143408-Pelagomonas_calceolata.AAC.5